MQLSSYILLTYFSILHLTPTSLNFFAASLIVQASGSNRIFTHQFIISNNISSINCHFSKCFLFCSYFINFFIDLLSLLIFFHELLQRRKDSGWSVISTVAHCSNQSEIIKPVTADQFSTSKPTVLILGILNNYFFLNNDHKKFIHFIYKK